MVNGKTDKSGLAALFFRRWAALAHDLLWVPLALYLAVWLRFNLAAIPSDYLLGTSMLLAVSLPAQTAAFFCFGLYRGFWRFASIPDLIRILKAVTIGSLVAFLLAMLLFRLQNVPRSVLLMYPVLLTLGLAGPRFIYRAIKDRKIYLRKQEGRRALIVGGGSAGESLARDLVRHEEYLPIGFLDDDMTKHGREIQGIRVAGGLVDLPETVSRLGVDVVLLAIPSAGRATVQRVVNACARAEVACLTLPSLMELGDRAIDVGHLRPITTDDLLGREPVHLDVEAIAGYLQGKSVLVTGGGGSIGSELCRQIARQQPDQLIILEQGEYNLYAVEMELGATFPALRLQSVLGDVKNRERVDWLFQEYRPQVVFHAAAYKHVPMVEANPVEGVHNNVSGTCVVADAADRYQVDRFVLVSTDKAVNPANVMGTTKRIAELYCQNLDSRSNTRFITTRFGNVLGSAGSVVPLFADQIRQGGPVTVTHPEISRYFMTIPESVSLILQAGSMGEGGEIFVLDMGAPVLIRDLAEQMIRLSGLEPEENIAITYIGLRPGEKLQEEVFHSQEGLRPTGHAKLLLAESRRVDWEWLLAALENLEHAARSRDLALLAEQLKLVVPEYDNGVKAGERHTGQAVPPA